MPPNLFSDAVPTPPTGFLYVADFLAPDEQRTLLEYLKTLTYEHDYFRGQRLKRSYAQFGYAYVSTGRKLQQAAELPDSLQAIIRKFQPHCPPNSTFNQCIVTHYPATAGIGWHTDAPQFADCIVGVSLGAAGLFQLRRYRQEAVDYEIIAEPGSLYVMHGSARWDYQHQVVPVQSERYSLTFRNVQGDQ